MVRGKDARASACTDMDSLESVPHFVDDYLRYLYEIRPTAATFDGVHAHDDHVEDFSRAAVDRQLRELGSFARRLAGIRPEPLSVDDRLDRAMLEADIQARVLELEQTRNHERNPQLYADTLATTLASQVVLDYAPAAERARRLVSKLRQVPAFLASARENVKDPPGLFVKTAVETLRGLLAFLDVDLPRALADLDDLSVLSDLADATTEASQAIGAYVEYLEKDLGPRARGSFRLGRDLFVEKLRLEEGVDLPLERIATIAERELQETEEAFRRAASRLRDGDPLETWEALKREHPPAGQLVAEARAQVGELRDFIEREGLVTIPGHEPIRVAPTPPFYRWTFASVWCPGPFEPRAVRAFYYLTDADPSWPPDRQEQHLRDFSRPALTAITMHEVYPGHYLHFQHLRRIPSQLRKSLLVMPTSVVEGWAHYAEHAMVEAGFDNHDGATVLGQMAESLVRLARLIVAIRLHADDWSVEQGVRFFRDTAFLEESSARREAERGTFDPGYGAYALGKLMLLKLRADRKRQQGAKFSLRGFHDEVLALGSLRLPLQRLALLGDAAAGDVIE
ncbi:MAG TPA: DUF885 domain-containing protein [Vicinamibacterales bacterium]